MAQTITQRIALTGGAEIKKELEALGREGEIAFKRLQAAANDLKGPGLGLTASLKGAATEIGKIGKVLVDAGRNVESLGKKISTSISLPLLAAGAASIKAFSDFEQGLAHVGSQIDLTKEDLGAIGTQIRELSTRTPVGLNDLVKAFGDIRSAGIGAADGMKILESSAKLAVAAQTDVVTAADAATSAINAFGLKGKDQARVFDLLFRAVESGKITLAELGDSFGKIGATIRASNVQLDEYLIALSALSRGGASAAEAQRSLNQVITQLNGNSKDTVAAIKALGSKSFSELVAKSGGLVEALKKLVAGAKGSKDELEKLFGSTQAVGAVLALVGPQFAAFNNELKASRSGANFLEETYARLSKTTQATLTQLRNQLVDVGVDIGTELVPVLKDVVEGISAVIKGFKDLDPETKALVINLLKIAAVAGPILIVVGKITQGIGGLAIAISFLLRFAIAPLLAGILALNPEILVFVGAVALIVGAVGVIADAFKGGASAAQTHANAMKAVADAADEVSKGVPNAKENLQKLSDKFLETAKSAVELARAQLKVAQTNLEVAKQAVNPVGAPRKDFDPLILNRQRALEDALNKLSTREEELQSLQDQINASTQVGLAATQAAADGAVAGINKAGEAVKSTITILSGGSEKIKTQVVELTNGLNESASAFTKNFGTLKEGAEAALTPITGLRDVVKTAGDGILRITDDTGKVLLEIGKSTDQISQSVTQVNEALTNLGEVGQRLSDATSIEAIATGARAVVTALTEATTQSQNASVQIQSAASAAAAAWTSVPAVIQQAAIAAGASILTIANAIQSVLAQVTAGMASIASEIDAAFAAAVNAVEARLQELGSFVSNIIASMRAELASLSAQLAGAQASLNSTRAQANGRATGGTVNGPGTGTSDSILSWLSNGEFVVRAAAVKKYGVGLLDALNNMRFDSSRFAVGGLARAASAPRGIPAFAAGGSVSGRAINLTIGGEEFAMSASQDVATKLSRYVMTKRARSSGRSPNWVG